MGYLAVPALRGHKCTSYRVVIVLVIVSSVGSTIGMNQGSEIGLEWEVTLIVGVAMV